MALSKENEIFPISCMEKNSILNYSAESVLSRIRTAQSIKKKFRYGKNNYRVQWCCVAHALHFIKEDDFPFSFIAKSIDFSGNNKNSGQRYR